MKIKVSINKNVVNKQVLGWSKIEECQVTPQLLAEEIKAGHSFGPLMKIVDKGESSVKVFISAQHIAIDFDHSDPTAIMAKEEIKDNFSIYYETSSSTSTNPRFRIVFLLEVPIYDSTTYEQLSRAMAWRFGSDLYATQACQMFYGSTISNPVITDNILNESTWKKWINEWVQKSHHAASLETRSNHLILSPLQVMVNSCPFFRWCQLEPDQVNYAHWLVMLTNLIEGAMTESAYGDSSLNEARLIFHQLSQLDQKRYDEHKTNEEFDKAAARFEQEKTLGYTYKYAIENGWVYNIPATLSRPAQIINSVRVRAPKRSDPFVWAAIPRSVTRKGEYAQPTYSTLVKILDYDERQKDRFSFNLMTQKVHMDGIPLQDADEIRLTEWLTDTYQLGIGVEIVRAAINTIAQLNRFHPVRTYLSNLNWDGIDRISQIGSNILHIEDNKLNNLVIRKWLLSAVARAMIPGCKVDVVLILVGPQGFFKSTFFRVLASDEWFNDSDIQIGRKEAYMVLNSHWFNEWAELQVMRRADREQIKAFITSQQDSYRPPYAHNEVTIKRTCIIVGTTNDNHFLVDNANRRYWPLTINEKIDISLLREWRDQIWAQAITLFNSGEEWWLPEQQEKEIADSTNAYTIEDAWESKILAWVENKTMFSISEVLNYALEFESNRDLNRPNLSRVADILLKNGWQAPSKTSRRGKVVGRFWINPDSEATVFNPDNEVLMTRLEEVLKG
jgi:predicted P-loop ATPase